jgi:hypothetical protein
MKTLTEKDAVELALAFAGFANIRHSELDNVEDVSAAIWSCKRLKRIQDKTGVAIAGHKDRPARRLKALKNLLKDMQGRASK